MHDVTHQAAVLVVLMSLVPLGAIALAGGAVSLVLTMMQVQEQSVAHLAKLIAIGVLVAAAGEAAFADVEQLFKGVMVLIKSGQVGRP